MLKVKIDELARKVEKHNLMLERQYDVERHVAVLENDMGQMRKVD